MKKELALNSNLKKLVLAAMFAALSSVATMVIQIPSPMSGYVNLGDCFVLLGGVVLGPVWGFLAGGVGSMLADVILGYAHYAPGTFLIKGLMALAVVLIFKSLNEQAPEKRVISHRGYSFRIYYDRRIFRICIHLPRQRYCCGFQYPLETSCRVYSA